MKLLKANTARILCIPDLHAPASHPDVIPFLKEVKKFYSPTLVIQLGDESDYHANSYHEADPDLPNAKDELTQARKKLAELMKLFPDVHLLESNHGSLLYRKALTHGFPSEVLRTAKEILNAPKGWHWHFDITLKLPTGNLCHFHHSRGANVLQVAKAYGMSVVQGHHHENFNLMYYSTPTGLHFGLTSGCLIDPKHRAFLYNKNNTHRPIIGCSIIINGVPQLIPMLLNSRGRWVGRLL